MIAEQEKLQVTEPKENSAWLKPETYLRRLKEVLTPPFYLATMVGLPITGWTFWATSGHWLWFAGGVAGGIYSYHKLRRPYKP